MPSELIVTVFGNICSNLIIALLRKIKNYQCKSTVLDRIGKGRVSTISNFGTRIGVRVIYRVFPFDRVDGGTHVIRRGRRVAFYQVGMCAGLQHRPQRGDKRWTFLRPGLVQGSSLCREEHREPQDDGASDSAYQGSVA